MKDEAPIELKFSLLLARFIETRDFVGQVVKPGKAEEKITPVSSAMASGKRQRSGK